MAPMGCAAMPGMVVGVSMPVQAVVVNPMMLGVVAAVVTVAGLSWRLEKHKA
jgi:hypothetical protein